MRRCTEAGGVFKDHLKDISRGCPLSPVMGALFQNVPDEQT